MYTNQNNNKKRKFRCSPEIFRLRDTIGKIYYKTAARVQYVVFHNPSTHNLYACCRAQWTYMLLLEHRFPEEDKIHDAMWLIL